MVQVGCALLLGYLQRLEETELQREGASASEDFNRRRLTCAGTIIFLPLVLTGVRWVGSGGQCK